MTRTRRNVYTLPEGDQTLYWYGQAVAWMKAQPRTKPWSWEFQAAVHGIAPAVPPATPEDPPGPPAPPLPENWAMFWRQCQHGSSFFLPWHRMYVLWFERIVAKIIEKDLNGPADWALPYWNYSDMNHKEWRVLPPAFRDPTSPLYVAERDPRANAGEDVLTAPPGTPEDAYVSVAAFLNAPGTTEGTGLFGDPRPGHTGTGVAGQAEQIPHGSIHVLIGGGFGGPNPGWMGNPDTAALDPIFWLHHSNIDRLWEVWLARDPNHQNLDTPFWLNGVEFYFHAPTGYPVSMVTQDVLDLTAEKLDYCYDDISDPLPPRTARLAAAGPTMPRPTEHELVGATKAPIVLDDQVNHVDLPTPVSAQAFRTHKMRGTAKAAVPMGPPGQLVQKVILELERVTSVGLAPMAPIYNVFLNNLDADHFVGSAPMFGIHLASNPAGEHGGGGMTFAFDITSLYHRLADRSELDPQNLRVTFVPAQQRPGAQIRVGRINLYFA